ncbi:VOC family protein [Rhizobium sp. P28RR-XV]|uniref:VOC family protein n=1 Tax=Rhizobium sp. P28RR-XV TaxID=2726737 RepID=UPI0014568921|nr:VOC family protein [Rhizobium sp. P28RR-XV]NLR88863.1 VOC family protein [Rhizobium sp. P28RR-XV]
MRLNQVTVTMPDLDARWNFYCTLGLKPVVDARPHYARFLCPDGDSTFSLHQGESAGGGTTVYFECDDLNETVSQLQKKGLQFTSPPEDKSWLWREAELFDPGGNRVLLYFAGQNRINPPWRIK